MNTAAAEVLYSTAGDVAGLDKDSTLIDVCCGTGTIGLCLADRCKEVVGVEIIEQAVEDANRNAKENGVANAHFRAGTTNHILDERLKLHLLRQVLLIALQVEPNSCSPKY